MPKISIVIPVYNSSKHLNQCIDSLLAQTLTDFEVITVNDGSKDNSLEILKSYAEKDKRFIIINKENEGQGVARNIAIEKASGEYLLCLDSDDWLENNALELCYNKIKQDNTDILFMDVYRFIERTQTKYLFKYTEVYKNFKNQPFTPQDAGEILLKTSALPYKMYRLSFIKENNITYSHHKFHEDKSFYIKSMLYANSISCLSIPLYNYRVSFKSATTEYKNYLEDMPEIYDICFDIIKNADINSEILKSCLQSFTSSLLYFYGRIPLNKKQAYHKMFQEIIKKHYINYEITDELENILNMNFFDFWLSNKIRDMKYLLGTYKI